MLVVHLENYTIIENLFCYLTFSNGARFRARIFLEMEIFKMILFMMFQRSIEERKNNKRLVQKSLPSRNTQENNFMN